MARRQVDEIRDGVELTSLDGPVFDGAGVTKRELLDHLDAVADRLLPALADRPLSVVRARPGQQPFMQKNLPRGAPDWIPTMPVWAESSQRTVHYPVCADRRTLLWFGNQRAIEFHPTLRSAGATAADELVIDLDPPPDGPFAAVVAAARLVRQALRALGLDAVVKTSGAKGLHLVVPLSTALGVDDAFAATRALCARAAMLGPDVATTAFIRDDRGGRVFLDPTRAGWATLVAVYSPRARPGLPVSFPVHWDDLDDLSPAGITVRTVAGLLGDDDLWRALRPAPAPAPAILLEEGRAIPVPRVQAMHEGKRRKRAREQG
ncbi:MULTISPECIES: DNA polymerase domain-containing protein [Pseudonocardia]|uniref:ATP-dependent DNA ligase n=2 Tax=Pseudonocardia TaxID=1847 RepID=A0ABQ0RWT6_9PSEU|nr:MULTISPECIES: ATP-dependent DNA ligase [Pseudonocardia]OSY40422.1 putative ATP-dependent DNA ligase YkoU [Pseudonocardia autotrophica]TDN72249.1 DNA ligase D-like protein (predicted polymerase) [Pseudonocardia autotrophica]BBG02959.1 ATP-dependent DNA ligase [Pseudonocardia autotrophica]GEC25140.1 ATP-dependent DNA ligase [Pseudonocardia saturnea]